MRGVGQAHGASKGASEMISRKSPTRTLRRRVLVVSACAAVAFAFASVRLVHAAVAAVAACLLTTMRMQHQRERHRSGQIRRHHKNFHHKFGTAAKPFQNKMRVKLPRWAPAVDLVTLVHVGVPLCALLCVVVHLL